MTEVSYCVSVDYNINSALVLAPGAEADNFVI